MRIAASPCHVLPPSQLVPSRWTRAMTARVSSHELAPAGPCTEAERPVDMDPGLVLVHNRRKLPYRIDRSGVHVAGLSADEGRSGQVLEQRAQRLRLHPSLTVGLHRLQGGCAE